MSTDIFDAPPVPGRYIRCDRVEGDRLRVNWVDVDLADEPGTILVDGSPQALADFSGSKWQLIATEAPSPE